MKLLTEEQKKSDENPKICYIRKKIENKYLEDKNYLKVRDHCYFTGEYIGVVYSICNLKYSVPKKILIVFHNGSNYDYHFIIKQVEEFKKQFTCLGENTDKCITFTVQIEKEVTKIVKNGEDITKNIYLTYYSLLIAQDLWRAHYQILLIIYLKDFIELNVNQKMMIKYVKHVELNISIAIRF